MLKFRIFRTSSWTDRRSLMTTQMLKLTPGRCCRSLWSRHDLGHVSSLLLCLFVVFL